MDISLEPKWADFIDRLVAEGRYDSRDEVVRLGLRLLAHREERLAELRATLQAALDEGGEHSAEEVMSSVTQALDEWEANRQNPAA